MGPARKKQRLSNGSASELPESDTTVQPVKENKNNETKGNEVPKDKKAEQSRRSLFVRNLPASTTSESLTELFSESYPVKHAVAVSDPATQQCRGYGFITFADAEDAQRARAEFNGHVLDGKKVRVEIAEPRQRHGEDAEADEAKAKAKQEKADADAQQAPKLIVRNLPWSIKNSTQLSNLFLSYGKVKQAYIPKRSGGLLPGFGFVLMRGRKNAEKAIEGVNGKEVDGRTIAVDWAITKDVYQKAAQGEEDKPSDEPTQVDDGEDDASDDGMDGVQIDGDDEEDEDESDDEDDDDGEEEDMEDDEEEDERIEEANKQEDKSTTLFVRNLPFSCTDEDLEDHFSQFGSTRYARIVLDGETGRPKGTGFVCFYEKEDCDTCLREAPSRIKPPTPGGFGKDGKPTSTAPSILQNVDTDPSGKYTLDGRVLQLSLAVNKSDANRLTQEGVVNRNRRDQDKRRLYLLSEGTVSTQSKLWDSLSPSERTMREASAKQRKTLIESNPSLHLSLTRLSIRNIPRSINSKDLKQLAREAIVGFATDVKQGRRQRLTREEIERGGEEMIEAEMARRNAGKGVVRQAKVVFEGEGGSKVSEATGAGRSRGYGFIEYHTHRNALMGLRWLNGHAVGYKVNEAKGKNSQEAFQDKKKRLIVEFAIENAQVVHRRQDREQKARERSKAVQDGKAVPADLARSKARVKAHAKAKGDDKSGSKKRKRDNSESGGVARGRGNKDSRGAKDYGKPKNAIEEKTAKRNRIIGQKRMKRKERQGGKK